MELIDWEVIDEAGGDGGGGKSTSKSTSKSKEYGIGMRVPLTGEQGDQGKKPKGNSTKRDEMVNDGKGDRDKGKREADTPLPLFSHQIGVARVGLWKPRLWSQACQGQPKLGGSGGKLDGLVVSEPAICPPAEKSRVGAGRSWKKGNPGRSVEVLVSMTYSYEF